MGNLNSPAVTYFLIASVIILIACIIRLEMRLKKILKGNTVNNIEDSIVTAIEDIEKLDTAKNNIEKEIQIIKNSIRKNIRTVETTRFNPFADVGSKQSFASAFIDDHGDGVVLSSLYSRDKVSVFAKPIKEYKSDYELSEEEKEVLKKSWESRKGL
ncbi:MAG: DUF4446 family protein [bacterium]